MDDQNVTAPADDAATPRWRWTAPVLSELDYSETLAAITTPTGSDLGIYS